MRTLSVVLFVFCLITVPLFTVLAQDTALTPPSPDPPALKSSDVPTPPVFPPKAFWTPPSAGPLGMLVRNSVVREHLGLTEEQIKQFEEVTDQAWADVLKNLTDITGGRPPHEWNPAVRRKLFTEMPFVMERITEDIVKKYEAILRPGEQVTKVRELAFLASEGIDFPMIGVAFLTILDLTDEQKQQIRDIQAGSRKKMRDLVDEVLGGLRDWEGTGPAIHEDTLQKFKEIGKETTQKIKDVLTEEQKKRAEEIKANGAELMQRIIAAHSKGPFGPPPLVPPTEFPPKSHPPHKRDPFRFGPPPPGSPPGPPPKRDPVRFPWMNEQSDKN